MICPSCGHEIDDDAAFCTECGARIDQPAAPEPDEPAPAKKRPLSVAQKAAIAGLVVALLAGAAGEQGTTSAPTSPASAAPPRRSSPTSGRT